MKKLLAVLLSMVMAMSLMVPAFADGPDGPPPADGGSGSFTVNGVPAPAWNPGDPVPFSLFLPEAVNDTSFGLIGGADGPTSIITNWINTNPEFAGMDRQAYQAALDALLGGADAAALEELAEALERQTRQQRDELKQSLGGVPGRTGVMVNGKYIQFPDAAPEVTGGRVMVPLRAVIEALGGEADVHNGTGRIFIDDYAVLFTIGDTTAWKYIRGADGPGFDKQMRTIEMDCAPYVKDGRAYVPVRFIAEALGWEVGWDSAYQTVILLNREALAADIDKDFTILNRARAAAPSVEEGKNCRADIACGVTVTAFDTINGNKTYAADLTGKALQNTQAVSGSYSFTLSDNVLDGLEKLLTSVYGAAFEEDALLVRTIAAGLKDMEVIMTAGGKVWVHAPVLDELTGKENVWGSTDLGAELGALLAIQMDAASLTIGSVAAGLVDVNSVAACAPVNEMVQMMAAVYGDDRFTTSGGTSTLTVGLDQLAALPGLDPDEVKAALRQFRLTMKVDGKGGATVTCRMETAAQTGLPGMKLTLDCTQSGGKTGLTMSLHAANVGEVKLELSAARQATDERPMTRPPAGASIMDMDAPRPLGS